MTAIAGSHVIYMPSVHACCARRGASPRQTLGTDRSIEGSRGARGSCRSEPAPRESRIAMHRGDTDSTRRTHRSTRFELNGPSVAADRSRSLIGRFAEDRLIRPSREFEWRT